MRRLVVTGLSIALVLLSAIGPNGSALGVSPPLQREAGVVVFGTGDVVKPDDLKRLLIKIKEQKTTGGVFSSPIAALAYASFESEEERQPYSQKVCSALRRRLSSEETTGDDLATTIDAYAAWSCQEPASLPMSHILTIKGNSDLNTNALAIYRAFEKAAKGVGHVGLTAQEKIHWTTLRNMLWISSVRQIRQLIKSVEAGTVSYKDANLGDLHLFILEFGDEGTDFLESALRKLRAQHLSDRNWLNQDRMTQLEIALEIGALTANAKSDFASMVLDVSALISNLKPSPTRAELRTAIRGLLLLTRLQQKFLLIAGEVTQFACLDGAHCVNSSICPLLPMPRNLNALAVSLSKPIEAIFEDKEGSSIKRVQGAEIELDHKESPRPSCEAIASSPVLFKMATSAALGFVFHLRREEWGQNDSVAIATVETKAKSLDVQEASVVVRSTSSEFRHRSLLGSEKVELLEVDVPKDSSLRFQMKVSDISSSFLAQKLPNVVIARTSATSTQVAVVVSLEELKGETSDSQFTLFQLAGSEQDLGHTADIDLDAMARRFQSLTLPLDLHVTAIMAAANGITSQKHLTRLSLKGAWKDTGIHGDRLVAVELPAGTIKTAPLRESHWGPKPLIAHQFTPPQRMPPATVSLVFLLLTTLVPLTVFTIGLWRLAPLSRTGGSGIYEMAFTFGIVGVAFLLFVYWTSMTLIQMTGILLLASPVLSFVGNRALSNLKSRNRFVSPTPPSSPSTLEKTSAK